MNRQEWQLQKTLEGMGFTGAYVVYHRGRYVIYYNTRPADYMARFEQAGLTVCEDLPDSVARNMTVEAAHDTY